MQPISWNNAWHRRMTALTNGKKGTFHWSFCIQRWKAPFQLEQWWFRWVYSGWHIVDTYRRKSVLTRKWRRCWRKCWGRSGWKWRAIRMSWFVDFSWFVCLMNVWPACTCQFPICALWSWWLGEKQKRNWQWRSIGAAKSFSGANEHNSLKSWSVHSWV